MSATDRKNAYQVVARRFRPRAFAEVVGQEAILQSLAGALQSGRIPHAYLFAGSRGVGKTTMARILARCLNCAKGPTPDPCGTCEPCVSILEDRNSDFVEIDAASHNSVDDIREMRERVAFATMGSRYKVYLLDEVHMLSKGAFNAFLKTLEEPPPRVVFIMATTEVHKVPETIRSRCQVLQFRQVSETDMVQRLQRICASEAVDIDPQVLHEIARGSRGGLRDAETALERVLSVAKAAPGRFDLDAYRRVFHRVGFEQARDVVASLIDGQAGPALRFAAEVVQSGGDEREAVGDLLDVLRALLLLVVDGKDTPLVAHDGDRDALLALAQRAGVERLDAMIQAGLVGRERIRVLEDRRLVMEVTLLRMARAATLPLLADLAAAVASGASVAPPPAAPASPSRVASAPAPTVAAPSSAPRPVAAAGSGDLAARLAAWLMQNKPLLQSTVAACQIHGPDAVGVVTLALDSERKLHRDRLQADGVKQLLKQALTELLGKPVQVAIVDLRAGTAGGAGSAPAAPPPGAAAPPPPAPDHVQRIAKKFDGRIVRAPEPPPE
jgi:DNA polymerase-3 subunit gamma/tau